MRAVPETSKMPLGRLKRRSDFLAAGSKGRKWVSKSLIVQILENNSDQIRFGLTVTKKTAAKAVDRNRIRRRLRALALQILPTLPNKACDIVLIGRDAALTANTEDLKRDLLWCLKRLEVQ